MSPTVLLVTDQQHFERSCRDILQEVGLDVRTANVEKLNSQIKQDRLVVFDAGCDLFDEDELLANVGFVRALNALAVVVLPNDGSMNSIEDILDILCPGLVSRSLTELPRLINLLSRRTEPISKQRFEYLTISPRPNEAMAIMSNGSAILMPRPICDEDDGTDVLSISLAEDATTAVLSLSSGKSFEVKAAVVAGSMGHQKETPPAASADLVKDINGADLGARLKNLRLAAGLTQAELARRTGIHRPNIARVEAGRHTPSLETLSRLASAIGVPTTSILTGD